MDIENSVFLCTCLPLRILLERIVAALHPLLHCFIGLFTLDTFLSIFSLPLLIILFRIQVIHSDNFLYFRLIIQKK